MIRTKTTSSTALTATTTTYSSQLQLPHSTISTIFLGSTKKQSGQNVNHAPNCCSKDSTTNTMITFS